MKRIFILFCISILFLPNAFAQDKKSLKELFANNEAIIYTINIRNFGAADIDGDGLIGPGDTKGTFINAAEKLKELKEEGINVIYLLPITKTGKLKALGTAGSLYAMDAFDVINNQLNDENSSKSLIEQAKSFVEKAHNLGFNVIIDLPSCGSYDLSIKKPDWFIEDKNIVPADWTDVRLFKIYNENKSLNTTTVENFKKFIDMVLYLKADGIRADVAAIKPKEFWLEIIKYAHKQNKDFLFLAEASPMWDNPAKNAVSHYSTTDELLNAGFDSYYGSWSNFADIKTKQDFDKNLNNNFKILNKHKNSSIISAIATHDQKAPILNGENYWRKVLWLSVTIPQNTYFLDGFKYGDDFLYKYENAPAKTSLTDDSEYFVHTGLFDIFNLTAPTRQKHPNLKKEYLKAIDFKKRNIDLITNGRFKLLKTGNEKVIAYSITNFEQELIVIASLDETTNQQANVTSKYIDDDYVFLNVTENNMPNISKNKISAELEPHQIKVFLIGLAKYRAM